MLGGKRGQVVNVTDNHAFKDGLKTSMEATEEEFMSEAGADRVGPWCDIDHERRSLLNLLTPD